MANQFLTVQEIARKCLPILKENLSFPALCHRDYESTFAKKGDTVQVKKPPVYVANEFDGSIVCQDLVEGGVAVQLNKIADVSVTLGPKEMALNLESFTEQVLRPAVAAIAEKVNADGMALIHEAATELGEAGVTPDSMNVFADAVKALNRNKAPFADRYAIWDPEAMSKLQLLEGVINAEKSGTTKALRDGSIGRILGMENFMSPSVPGGAVADTTRVVLDTNATVGAKNLSLVFMDGKKLNKGTKLQFSGQTFTVAGDYTTAGDGKAVNVAVMEAVNKTISMGSEGLVVAGNTCNLAFQKNAFAFVTRPLEPARGVESYLVEYEGLPLRVTLGYDMHTKEQTMSVDMLYGFVTLYPEFACRILG